MSVKGFSRVSKASAGTMQAGAADMVVEKKATREVRRMVLEACIVSELRRKKVMQGVWNREVQLKGLQGGRKTKNWLIDSDLEGNNMVYIMNPLLGKLKWHDV